MRSLRYIGNHCGGPAVKTDMRAFLAAAVLLAVAGGCGTEQAPRTEPISHEVILEVEHARALPVALYADGRVFTPAPVIAIYPAPALPAFNIARIPPDRAASILARVEASGVLDAKDGGSVLVTAMVDGERRVIRLRAEDAERIDALLGDLPVVSDSLYEPTALAVIAAAPEPSFEEPDVRDWPLGDLPPGCSVVRGADLDTVLAAAAQANQLTRWRIAGGLMVGVTFRPLLPHERSCDDVAPA